MQYKFINVTQTAEGRVMTIQRSHDNGTTWEEFGVPIVKPDGLTLFANEIICRYVAGDSIASLKSIVRTIADNF